MHSAASTRALSARCAWSPIIYYPPYLVKVGGSAGDIPILARSKCRRSGSSSSLHTGAAPGRATSGAWTGQGHRGNGATNIPVVPLLPRLGAPGAHGTWPPATSARAVWAYCSAHRHHRGGRRSWWGTRPAGTGRGCGHCPYRLLAGRVRWRKLTGVGGPHRQKGPRQRPFCRHAPR